MVSRRTTPEDASHRKSSSLEMLDLHRNRPSRTSLSSIKAWLFLAVIDGKEAYPRKMSVISGQMLATLSISKIKVLIHSQATNQVPTNSMYPLLAQSMARYQMDRRSVRARLSLQMVQRTLPSSTSSHLISEQMTL